MFKKRESRNAFIRSLIASSVFLLLIKPILEGLWKVVVKTSGASYTYILDHIYEAAALGQRNWLDFILLAFGALIVISSLIMGSSLIRFRLRKSQLETSLHQIEDEEAKASLIKEYNKLTATSKMDRAAIILGVKYHHLIEGALIISVIWLLFSSFTDLQLNTSFNQRLNAISPYISEVEIRNFRSQWALMKTRKDFVKINMAMESVGHDNKIKLPENLLP